MRIQPGERGSWPRASVRLIDLPDGAQSEGATLELADRAASGVPPNLDGDPGTDELIDLLSGGAAGAREQSPTQQRYVEDQEELRRASAVGPGDYRELAADAARGRPDVDLAAGPSGAA